MCCKLPSAVIYNRKSISLCPPLPKYQLTKLLNWKPKGAHQAKCTLGICAKPWKHMREVQFTACAPCALHLLKISWQKLLSWTPKGANKSSQKHPGDMRDAIKTYARRTVHSLCNLCPSPPRNYLTKLLPWKPKGTHQAKTALGYARSYKNMILWCA